MLACWSSPEYQAARALRLPAATAALVVIEGYDGAQPQPWVGRASWEQNSEIKTLRQEGKILTGVRSIPEL